jgi:hypothetical protein
LLLIKPKHAFYINTLFPKTVRFIDDCKKSGTAGETAEAANDLNTVRCDTHVS